jgi:hypothetical protein
LRPGSLGKLSHQKLVPQGLTPVREAFDDAKVDLAIEPFDLGTYGSDGLVLTHGFV